MIEAQPYQMPEKPSDRPTLQSIEKRAKGRHDVAKHEFTHIVAIWGVGKSVRLASVVPTSEYLGVTIPGSDMSASQMQIAAMASADHAGNGSDQMKAHLLERFGGITAEEAESRAKKILSSYREDVLSIASLYLAAEGYAGEQRLQQYLRWAEEEVREQEAYKDMPIPSWSDEVQAIREEKEKEEKLTGETTLKDQMQLIRYQSDGNAVITSQDGSRDEILDPTQPPETLFSKDNKKALQISSHPITIFDASKSKRYRDYTPNSTALYYPYESTETTYAA